MKKLLSIILTICLMITVLPLGVFDLTASAETTKLNGVTLTYSVSNGEATITDCSTSISGDVTIPETLGGYPVTCIGDHAFDDCRVITSIMIPDGVTCIGNYAFYYCTNLASINIPDGVTCIGDHAFVFTSLTSINIPGSVISIGDLSNYYLKSIEVDESNQNYCDIDGVLFNEDATKLIQYPESRSDGSYTIPDSVTSIGDFAFQGCRRLTSLTIPDSVKSIGDHAFSYADFTSIVIGTDVTSIGNYAFAYCTNLASINIPDSVTSIGDYAFDHCNSLASINIPDSVTSIGDHAFGYCTSLASINIPDSVTSIGDHAFGYCTSLASIIMGTGVTSIGACAFGDCTSLTNVWYTGTESDKSKITISSGNSQLTCATWHYNTCDFEAHVYSNGCDADCNNCGWIRTPSDHIYENNCDANCNECGLTRSDLEHIYDNDCDAYCNVCGTERTPSDHIYDNDCDAYCNVCGVTRTVLGHIFTNACDPNCSECGFVRITQHSYADRVCTVCACKETSVATNDISAATIEGVRDEVNVSEKNEQNPTLILYDTELKLNIDYVVWYYNTASIGTAKMLIIGIGDYTGYIEKEYEITGTYNIKIGESVEIPSSTPVKLTIGDTYDEVAITYDGELLITLNKTEAEEFFSKSYLFGPSEDDEDGIANWSIKQYSIHTYSAPYWNGSYMVNRVVTEHTNIVTSQITTFDSQVTELTWAGTQPIVHKDKIFIQPKIYPIFSYNQELVWESANTSVATVDNFGVVTILTPGTCLITASTQNGLSIKQELNIEAMNINNVNAVVCVEDGNNMYDFVLSDNYGVMNEGIDYEVSYRVKNNIIYATFKGKGLYDGTLMKYYDTTNNLNELSREELPYEFGDVDGEDGITDWDGVMLARYLAGWTVEIAFTEALDIDGDGEITDWDGVLLDRYLAGWNVEIG